MVSFFWGKRLTFFSYPTLILWVMAIFPLEILIDYWSNCFLEYRVDEKEMEKVYMKPPLAQDFVTLNGLNKIILPALRSSEEDLIAKGAIVLGSASQSNTKVQVCEFLGFFCFCFCNRHYSLLSFGSLLSRELGHSSFCFSMLWWHRISWQTL